VDRRAAATVEARTSWTCQSGRRQAQVAADDVEMLARFRSLLDDVVEVTKETGTRRQSVGFLSTLRGTFKKFVD